MTTFTKKLLRFTFTLGPTSFVTGRPQSFQGGANRVVLSGLRASVKIIKPGQPGSNHAQARIYGMDIGTMNQLSTLGVVVTLVTKNQIVIEAGDSDSNMAVVFQGNIRSAWPDLNASPDVPLHVEAYTGYADGIIPLKPASFPNGADVAEVMAGLATSLNYSFENNGVAGLVSPSLYLWGPPRSQIDQVGTAMKFKMGYVIDDSVTANATLAIWPEPRGSRGGRIPLINKDTGMVGYPTYSIASTTIRTTFNPSIRFKGKVKVESSLLSLASASGIFVVQSLTHDLDTQVPGGSWYTSFDAIDPLRNIPIQDNQG